VARPLRVYSWQGHRAGAHPDAPWNGCTTEVIAAPSVAAVMRATGKTRAALFNLGTTANEHDVAMATAEPGVWFWRGIDDRHGEWKRDASTPKRES
jgi:hypothetical protein